MKTIEELAKESGIEYEGHYDSATNGDYIEYSATESQLESFAKSYMQDRLSELEPVAYFSNHLRDEEYGEHRNNVLMLDDIHNFDVDIDENMENYKKWVSGLKLYDISSILENK